VGDKEAVGAVFADLGEPSSLASLYRVHQDALVFARTLTRDEYNAWLIDNTGGGQ